MLPRIMSILNDAGLERQIRDCFDSAAYFQSSDSIGEIFSGKNTPLDVLLIARNLLGAAPEDVVRQIRNMPDSPWVIIFTESEDAGARAALLGAGCTAVLNPTLDARDIVKVIEKIIDERRSLVRENLAREAIQQPRLRDFSSENPSQQSFVKLTRKVAASDATLLILGETGVGKERLARAIHYEGRRKDGPFVAINCGALPEHLLESELFGHERGAFTGASRTRRGCFEMAHCGTLFLDEIGDLPYHLQVKLLRALQEKEIRHLGGEERIKLDVRIMAATNSDIEADVKNRKFRQDLYFRLSVVTITVPPLRSHPEDIPLLVEKYLNYLRSSVARKVHRVAPDALDALRRYHWPGNIRELVNVIERAMLICEDDIITLRDLPDSIGGQTDLSQGLVGGATFPAEWLAKPWREVRELAGDQLECWYFARLLELTGGKISDAAAHAGIDVRSINEKMRVHGLRKEYFKHLVGRN